MYARGGCWRGWRVMCLWARGGDDDGFGGVRLEQNVLITDGVPEILMAAVPL